MSFASLLSERLDVDPLAFNLLNLGSVKRIQIHIGNLTQPPFTPGLPNQGNLLYYLCLPILFPLVGTAVYRGRALLSRRAPPTMEPISEPLNPNASMSNPSEVSKSPL